MTSSHLFLAVDGGNSKTDIVLGTTHGEVLAFVRGPGSSPHALGVPGAMRLLETLVADARLVAGVAPTARVTQAAVFMAGADLPVEIDRLSKELTALGWADRVFVDNDTFALLRAGTAVPDAVAVVCGAGINGVGRTADGRTARFPSLGDISGDWGGGQHLGKLALYHAVRGEDGRGPATALTSAVAVHFGQSTVEQVSEAIHFGDLRDEAVYTALSPVLFAVAAAGDAVATRVVRKQADEILALHRVVITRLSLREVRHAVVLGGGVLRARHPMLHDAVLAGIREAAPLAEVTVVADPPVAGAALLALDTLGRRGTALEARLREALRRPPVAAAVSSAAA